MADIIWDLPAWDSDDCVIFWHIILNGPSMIHITHRDPDICADENVDCVMLARDDDAEQSNDNEDGDCGGSDDVVWSVSNDEVCRYHR